jgi:hypothetical protein
MNNAHPTLPSAAASTHGAAFPSLELLEARQLRDALKLLLRKEQAAMAEFLVALADFDRRRGWEALGHSSLFAFLHVELQLSRSATFWRLSAARLLQRFPEIIEPLRDGRLCLTTTAELARVLTEENRTEVLPRFFGLSTREAVEVTAALLPREQPPLRTMVTQLEREQRAAAAAAHAGPAVAFALLPAPVEPPVPIRTVGAVLAPEPTSTQRARGMAPRDDIEPLTADLRRLHITVSREFLRDLETARDGLSHAVPNATTEQVLKEALRLLLEKQARARGLVKKPRTTTRQLQEHSPPLALVPTEPPPPRREGPREAIPAAVRGAVWERDAGRCSWPLDSGGCCGSAHRPRHPLGRLVSIHGGESSSRLPPPQRVCGAPFLRFALDGEVRRQPGRRRRRLRNYGTDSGGTGAGWKMERATRHPSGVRRSTRMT